MFVIVLCALVAYANAANRLCYGDIMKLTPHGKASGGVTASNSIVSSDLAALTAHKNCYDASADRNCIQASVIAALASRESNGGSALRNGYGDGGKAWGILQCDIVHSGQPCTSVPWNSCEHIEMMVHNILLANIHTIQRMHPTWPPEHQLQGAVAAYNFGTRNVQTWAGVDVGTTGGDYSNDVMARAQWLHNHGWN
ncbi:glycine, glutamate and proline-rich protein-like [Biomphalaria glabrata]|uniref:Glycine, glutamate and proline-rich protein-like n=1 Tax=Biomphalaria glabrata TaxID=6526 RepID=A0A9W2YNS3_BIOGL|nr:glycine, glutamate and proline-rich protein-like [Biomphalaria glabrata]